ncbi:hypothetical protein BSKO_01903 [Bryopsis sp. KO-2023]|nr:hypothetical protein BSKO_01903 [Bryopsis sp. KO-2023]
MSLFNIRDPEHVPERVIRPQFFSSFGTDGSVEFNIYEEAEDLLGRDALILDGYDLRDLFKKGAHDASEIIKVIGQHGVRKLGEMDIEASLVKHGFKGRTSKTMGHDDLEVNDWQRMWLDKLLSGKRLDPAFVDDRMVRVEAFAVTIRNASGAGRNGLLHPILKKWQAKACPIEVWGLPAIRAVVSFKWNHWAKHYLLMEFCLYMLWTIVFTVEALTYKEEDLTKNMFQLWNDDDSHGKMMVVLSFLSTFFMLPFTLIEVSTIIRYRTRWYNLWNVIDVLTQFVQVTCTVLYLATTKIEPNTFNLLLATQTVLLLVKIQFFARAFVAVESSMLDMLKAVLRQMRWYLLIVGLTMYTFTVALYIMFRLQQKPDLEALTQYREQECPGEKREETYDRLMECKPWECNTTSTSPLDFEYCIPRPFLEFDNIFRAFLTMYGLMLGAWEMEDYLEDAPYPYITLSFFVIYMLIMSVLLYNLLIAMMIDSHARQMEVRKLWVHVSRAEIIDELETALPKFITKRHQEPFIHALRIVPPKHASMDSLWTQLSTAETSFAARKEEFEVELLQTEKDLMETIEGISESIRKRMGLSKSQYVSKLYSKLGISRLQTQNTLAKMRMPGRTRTFRKMQTIAEQN